ncbi:MAG: HIT domain-containing protein [Elusimicrobia bacterium]|jgi:ATP adenylyltransferase|nr:HIT domain-containing protein [Elusimicrobiota bacterium]
MSKQNPLWAPWRVEYITKSNDMDCIFCFKPSENQDKKNHIIFRGEKVFAMLNKYPYNNGHIMVSSYTHKANLTDLTDEELKELMSVVVFYTKKIKSLMQPDGFNVGMNIGKTAGAGFDEHIHMHIVPRWEGDTNFMPVIGRQEVISESLDSVYDKLKTVKI